MFKMIYPHSLDKFGYMRPEHFKIVSVILYFNLPESPKLCDVGWWVGQWSQSVPTIGTGPLPAVQTTPTVELFSM